MHTSGVARGGSAVILHTRASRTAVVSLLPEAHMGFWIWILNNDFYYQILVSVCYFYVPTGLNRGVAFVTNTRYENEFEFFFFSSRSHSYYDYYVWYNIKCVWLPAWNIVCCIRFGGITVLLLGRFAFVWLVGEGKSCRSDFTKCCMHVIICRWAAAHCKSKRLDSVK